MREHRQPSRAVAPPANPSVPVVSIGIGARIRQLARRNKRPLCIGCRSAGIGQATSIGSVGFCRDCLEASRAINDLGGEG